jgi:hypothetical protein
MEWDDPLVIHSLESGSCKMCDSSYDPRDIREHLADVHKIGKSSRTGQVEAESGQIRVREHTRNRPRRRRK